MRFEESVKERKLQWGQALFSIQEIPLILGIARHGFIISQKTGALAGLRSGSDPFFFLFFLREWIYKEHPSPGSPIQTLTLPWFCYSIWRSVSHISRTDIVFVLFFRHFGFFLLFETRNAYFDVAFEGKIMFCVYTKKDICFVFGIFVLKFACKIYCSS